MATVSLDIVNQFASHEALDSAVSNSAAEVPGDTNYVFQVRIDNSANTSTVYLRFWDASSTPTSGSTVPDFIFPCAGESVAEFSFFPGLYTANTLYMAVSTTAGTSGNAAPSSSVIVRILSSNTDNEL
mgnify:CR=1 FL=1